MKRLIFTVLLFFAGLPMAGESYTKNVAIVVFDGVEILDLAAPGEVFAIAGRYGASGQEPEYRVYTVAASRAPVVSQGFLDVTPDYDITDAPRPDILVLPGGRAENAYNNANLMSWIASSAAGAEHVLTICYGSFIAGRAGLLDQLEITTWYGSVKTLGDEYPTARAIPGRRFTDNGKVITTAGVAAGLDGSLHLVARNLGRYVADRTAEYMEYPWTPQSQESSRYPQLNPRLDARGKTLQRASIAARDRDFDVAVPLYRKLTLHDAGDTEAWLQLGKALHAAKRYPEAIDAFSRVTAAAAQQGEAWYRLARAYAMSGVPAKAVESLSHAIDAGYRFRSMFERDPDLISIRNDPRFRELVSKL